MENATKALLIAGGVLIAVIILSIAVFLYASYSEQMNQYEQIISNTEIQKFNSKFEVYIGRDNVKAQEIVSVYNLAKEYNGEINIEIKEKFKAAIPFTSSESFIKEYQDVIFSCEYENAEYDNMGKITKLIFIKNS